MSDERKPLIVLLFIFEIVDIDLPPFAHRSSLIVHRS
jgi:hypothetical protein